MPPDKNAERSSWTADGVACRGLLIRHLVMPGMPDDSRSILQWLADEISQDTFVNIMGQYRPANKVGRISAGSNEVGSPHFQEINRRPDRSELEAAYEAARVTAPIQPSPAAKLAGGREL